MPVPVQNALAALPVRDVAAAAEWYSRLLGRTSTAEPMNTLQEWRFAAGGWLQIYENAERAGGGAVTLVVPDIEACRSWLETQGYTGISSIDSGTASIAMLSDPDGNQVVFAQSNNPVTNPSVVSHG